MGVRKEGAMYAYDAIKERFIGRFRFLRCRCCSYFGAKVEREERFCGSVPASPSLLTAHPSSLGHTHSSQRSKGTLRPSTNILRKKHRHVLVSFAGGAG